MIEQQTGSGGDREAWREARVLGNVAERAVESHLTLSLMNIDGSITAREKGLGWQVLFTQSTKSHGSRFSLWFLFFFFLHTY